MSLFDKAKRTFIRSKEEQAEHQFQKDMERARDRKSEPKGNWVHRQIDNWKQSHAEERAAQREGYLRGLKERGAEMGRGYKSRTHLMSERPPRYSDGGGYGRRGRQPYRRQYYQQEQQYQQPPQQQGPTNIMDIIGNYEERIGARKPRRRFY